MTDEINPGGEDEGAVRSTLKASDGPGLRGGGASGYKGETERV